MESGLGNLEKSDRKLSYFVFAVIAVAYSFYAFYLGPWDGGDTHWYESWAQSMLEIKRGVTTVGDYLTSTQPAGGPAINYFNFSFAIFLSKLTFGDSWMYSMLVYNLLLELLSVFVVLRLVEYVLPADVRHAGIIMVGLLLFFGFDYYCWIPWLMTDASCILASTLFIGALFLALVGGNKPAFYYWGLAMIAFFIVFITRPAWPPFLVLLLFSATFINLVSIDDPARRVNSLKKLVVGGTLFSAALVVLYSYLIARVPHMTGADLPAIIVQVSSWFQHGEVMLFRPEMNHETPEGTWDIMMIIGDRFIHFFAITAKGFAPIQTLANCAFYLPMYGFGLIAVYDMFKVENSMPKKMWLLAFTCIFFIIIYDFYISFLVIDHGWRYRVPTLPALLILAGIGVGRFFEGSNIIVRSLNRIKGIRIIGALVAVPIVLWVAIAVPQFTKLRKQLHDKSAEQSLTSLVIRIEAYYGPLNSYPASISSFGPGSPSRTPIPEDIAKAGFWWWPREREQVLSFINYSNGYSVTATSNSGSGKIYTWDSIKNGKKPPGPSHLFQEDY